MECEPSCRSSQHISGINRAIRLINDESQLKLIIQSCHKSLNTADENGKLIVHQIASLDQPSLLIWLLKKRKESLNFRDLESSWTPLHRAFYYGRIHSAVNLIKMGANLFSRDNEGFSPLHILKLNNQYISFSQNPSECGLYDAYTWGENSSYSLGHGTGTSTATAELVKTLGHRKFSINKVVMCKFHTLFLCSDGGAYSCGIGTGGRLGHPEEPSVSKPTRMRIPNRRNMAIKSVAAAVNHTLLLGAIGASGHVFGCGLNDQQQLGVPLSEVAQWETLNQICADLSKTDDSPKHIAAGRYHSCIATKSEVLTFGLNVGQIGHKYDGGKCTLPRKVTGISDSFNPVRIRMLRSSNAAVVVVCSPLNGIKKEGIYYMHEYKVKFISFKWAKFEKSISEICVIGGRLDTRHLTQYNVEKDHDLAICWLNNVHELYIWHEQCDSIRRVVCPDIGRELHITSIYMGRQDILMTTKDGSLFLTHWYNSKELRIPIKKPSRPRRFVPDDQTLGTKGIKSWVPGFPTLRLRSSRIPMVHRAIGCAMDPKAKNFAAIQAREFMIPREADEDVHETYGEFINLLQSADPYDNICDVTLISKDGEAIPSHKFILVNRSSFLREFIEANRDSDQVPIPVPGSELQFMLTVIYGGGADSSRLDSSISDKIASPDETSNSTTSSKKRKSKKVGSKQRLMEKYGLESLNPSLLTFDVDGPHADVHLKTEEGNIIKCHKCVLAARLEYFNMMLSMNWKQSGDSITELNLAIPENLLSPVIQYLYTRDKSCIPNSPNVEFVLNILVICDQMLFTELKSVCEESIISQMSLSTVIQLYQLSYTYTSENIKKAALDLICLNIAELIESGQLNDLEPEHLDGISSSYRSKLTCAYARSFDNNYISTPERLLDIQRTVEAMSNPEEPCLPLPSTPKREGTPEPSRKARRRRTSSGSSSPSPQEKPATASRALRWSKQKPDSVLDLDDSTFAEEFDDIVISKTPKEKKKASKTEEPVKSKKNREERQTETVNTCEIPSNQPQMPDLPSPQITPPTQTVVTDEINDGEDIETDGIWGAKLTIKTSIPSFTDIMRDEVKTGTQLYEQRMELLKVEEAKKQQRAERDRARKAKEAETAQVEKNKNIASQSRNKSGASWSDKKAQVNTTTVSSLADIMKQQAVISKEERRRRSSSGDDAPSSYDSSNKPHARSAKSNPWKTLSSDGDTSRDSNRMKNGQQRIPVPVQKDAAERAMEYAQIEERAMKELLDFYRLQSNGYEIIRVERVRNNFPEPVSN